MSLMGKIRRWHEIPMIAESLGWLFFAWLVLDVLPGKLYRHWMQPELRAVALTEEERVRVVRRVGFTVAWTSHYLPWRSVCFHRGIAAHQMLRRRGVDSTLHYGVNPKENLKAHVWITAHGLPVVGVRESEGYTQIAAFPGPAKTGVSAI